MEYTSNLFDSSQCFPILMYVFIFILYCMCFSYLYRPKVEFMGFILLFGLHTLMTGSFISSLMTSKTFNQKLNIVPYSLIAILSGVLSTKFGGWDGSIPICYFIMFVLIIVFISMVLMTIAFFRLHKKSVENGKDIELGSPYNKKIKNDLKKIYIIETVMIWVMYFLYTNYGFVAQILDLYILPRKRTVDSFMKTNPTIQHIVEFFDSWFYDVKNGTSNYSYTLIQIINTLLGYILFILSKETFIYCVKSVTNSS